MSFDEMLEVWQKNKDQTIQIYDDSNNNSQASRCNGQ